ncbi:MAG: hypothetical protein H0V44_14915 [Planctomycetes bacterium]|nr:hypothetical protein [Planctomycetota bacterium]
MDARDLEGLLRHIAAAAVRREDLVVALRASDIRGAQRVAAVLERGDTLAQALTEDAPEPVLALLAGPRPPLEYAALLAAEELRARRVRHEVMRHRLAYPITSLVMIAAAMGWMVHRCGAPLDLRWLWTAVPGVVVLAGALILPWCHELVTARVPIVGTWSYHVARAGWYARAMLASRWRMTEDDIERYLGSDLARLAPVLGRADAEEHCARLAAYHRDVGDRHARWLARIVAAAITSLAAAVMLAVTMGLLGTYLQVLDRARNGG